MRIVQYNVTAINDVISLRRHLFQMYVFPFLGYIISVSKINIESVSVNIWSIIYVFVTVSVTEISLLWAVCVLSCQYHNKLLYSIVWFCFF